MAERPEPQTPEPICPACGGRGFIYANLSCGECDGGHPCPHSGGPCPHGCPDRRDPIPV